LKNQFSSMLLGVCAVSFLFGFFLSTVLMVLEVVTLGCISLSTLMNVSAPSLLKKKQKQTVTIDHQILTVRSFQAASPDLRLLPLRIDSLDVPCCLQDQPDLRRLPGKLSLSWHRCLVIFPIDGFFSAWPRSGWCWRCS
jgi:hypothetical protein